MNGQDRESALRRALEQHRINLANLELQIAQYGTANAPIALINSVTQERAEIERLEEELSNLEKELSALEQQAEAPARHSKQRRVTMQQYQLSDKLEDIQASIHSLELRLTRVEADINARLIHVEKDVNAIREMLVKSNGRVEPVPKWVLVAGGVIAILTLILVTLIVLHTW